jgi:hypothetical protein
MTKTKTYRRDYCKPIEQVFVARSDRTDATGGRGSGILVLEKDSLPVETFRKFRKNFTAYVQPKLGNKLLTEVWQLQQIKLRTPGFN